ncbi:hypothetical protein ZEAMMB73_Zm00001d032016 [Zea mays]|uniref:Uncharacterized protein n=2 Tax=Zea mays TaxID=4577 RepID=C0PLQ5_MAIZE|nr:unknown [Zea mays]ONM04212.1 hypothetical protein ZEAMMB73_Zm00001d032016 [Zea mays]ONM04215.1 hypothetical protein ZEAMMB73_Zm00001d032016 [Zea mays]ONM04216.1 hypothetical protein ZEAMMB73_Zm00001d032016 [Zea mays]ONM04217.1 hypothetical protein ZEAMMB73_Zm00001d032016 [Zea mays]|eukprot:NP_001288438.1 hypothetical protein [Zea mays]
MALPTRSVVPLSAIRALIPFLRAAPFHPWLASRNPPTYGAASQSGIHPQNHYPLCGDGRESKRVLPPSILGVARIAWPSFRAPNPSMQGTRASPFHPRRCANCRLRIAWSSFRPSSLPASDGRAPRSASPPSMRCLPFLHGDAKEKEPVTKSASVRSMNTHQRSVMSAPVQTSPP